MSRNISFFAFTATPKKRTLETFSAWNIDANSPRPFHDYTISREVYYRQFANQRQVGASRARASPVAHGKQPAAGQIGMREAMPSHPADLRSKHSHGVWGGFGRLKPQSALGQVGHVGHAQGHTQQTPHKPLCRQRPDARLFRKGAGKEAKLSHIGHPMTENRNGLIVDVRLTEATGTPERTAPLDMIEDNDRPGSTIGGDKNYDTADFVAGCRERGCVPHVAQNTTNRRSVIDRRTTAMPVPPPA